MKILQIITLSDLGGAQSVVLHLVNAYAKQGHEVLVISSKGGKMWEAFDERVIKVECNYFKREIDPILDLKAIFFIRKIYKKFNPDIIHLHSSKAGVWGRIAGWFQKEKIIYTIHGFDTILNANRIFLPIEKILSRRTNFFVPVSEYDQKLLMNIGIKNTRIIKNAIPDIVNNDLLRDLFFEVRSNNKKIVLSVARLSPQKKFEMFLDVARSMKDESILFYWIGNQAPVDNLPENVKCLGEIPNASQYVKHCDLFVLFSNYEGLPISILEAFASSVPVVASAVGGVTELLDGNNGIAVENNVSIAVDAIRFFLNDNIKMQQSKKAARLTYEKYFTIDKMVNSYFELYKECRK